MALGKIKVLPERTVQIVCDNAALAQAYRSELERCAEPHRVASVSSTSEARLSLARTEPAVILLDDSATEETASLQALVSFFTETAPVIVVAEPERESDLTFLIASGAVDFVKREDRCASIAAGLVKRRLRLADCAARAIPFPRMEDGENFGEILRHEVNNPLTGILGNAELLLARRDRLPAAAIERLETIAALAVRLRETVRRLSHAPEERPDHPVRSA